MDGKVLGVERRRRWSKDEKARIVDVTVEPGDVVSDAARRHGVAQSLLFTWRRQARVAELTGRDGSILLPVEIGAMATPSPGWGAADGQLRAASTARRRSRGDRNRACGSGGRDARRQRSRRRCALGGVLGVLSER